MWHYSILKTLHWGFDFPGWDSGMQRNVPYIEIFTAIQLCIFLDREETRAVSQDSVLIPVVGDNRRRATLITNHLNPHTSGLTWSIDAAFIPFFPLFLFNQSSRKVWLLFALEITTLKKYLHYFVNRLVTTAWCKIWQHFLPCALKLPASDLTGPRPVGGSLVYLRL